ncbi:MAG: TnpV protein [Clostridia bacterium]|nr:TnpV protein [Clostridia bacterium]
MATLGRYGVIVKKNMEELYPMRYSELTIEGTLMDRLLEREQEILKQKDIIEKQLKEKNPAPKTSEFIVMAKYNQYIESLTTELLKPMLEEKI